MHELGLEHITHFLPHNFQSGLLNQKSELVCRFQVTDFIENYVVYDGRFKKFFFKLWIHPVWGFQTCLIFWDLFRTQYTHCFFLFGMHTIHIQYISTSFWENMLCLEWLENLVVCGPQLFTVWCPVFLCYQSQSQEVYDDLCLKMCSVLKLKVSIKWK